VNTRRLGLLVSLFLCAAAAGSGFAGSAPARAAAPLRVVPTRPRFVQPWIEGVDPALENRLFYATYGALETHNVLKVYVFSAGGYESAGIRFSGRVPHEQRDLSVSELAAESVTLIRTAFDEFPQIDQLDVWATVPVAQSLQTSVENTVFSVSADRQTYERIASRTEVTDLGFLASFGRIWVAPQVPR
jgi:hypothetical protein